MGSEVQKKLASLLTWAMIVRQSLPKIMCLSSFLIRRGDSPPHSPHRTARTAASNVCLPNEVTTRRCSGTAGCSDTMLLASIRRGHWVVNHYTVFELWHDTPCREFTARQSRATMKLYRYHGFRIPRPKIAVRFNAAKKWPRETKSNG